MNREPSAEHLKHWRNNTPPPPNKPGKYNQLVTLSFRWSQHGGSRIMTVTGLVSWDSQINSYYFQNMERNPSTNRFEKRTTMIPAANYLAIKVSLFDKCGITIIRGLRDEDKMLTCVPNEYYVQ